MASPIFEVTSIVDDMTTPWQSSAVLGMYRSWVADGKLMPVEELTELAVRLVCEGYEALR